MALSKAQKPGFRRNKYGVSDKRDRTVDGVTFASKAEARRYSELRILQGAGHIVDLRLQPRFCVVDAFTHPDHGKIGAVHYVADFAYRVPGEKRTTIEDVKGHETAVYKIKKKLFLQRYPEYRFEEVRRR